MVLLLLYIVECIEVIDKCFHFYVFLLFGSFSVRPNIRPPHRYYYRCRMNPIHMQMLIMGILHVVLGFTLRAHGICLIVIPFVFSFFVLSFNLYLIINFGKWCFGSLSVVCDDGGYFAFRLDL